MSTASEAAANYGYTLSFFNSDPELKKLLSNAISQGWSTTRFVANFRNTAWFRKHGENARRMYALQKSDPATYLDQLRTTVRHIIDVSRRIGANHLTGPMAAAMAHTAMAGNWSDEQIIFAIRNEVKPDKYGQWGGQAANVATQVDQIAADYGVDPSSNLRGQWVRNIVTGTSSIDEVKMWAIRNASSNYPALRDRLRAGETLMQIADPYKQQMAKTLEMNPEQITLNDPHIQQALSAKDSSGKPDTQTLWQFGQTLRQDPRWLKTQNAQDALVGQTHKVLQDFGLVN